MWEEMALELDCDGRTGLGWQRHLWESRGQGEEHVQTKLGGLRRASDVNCSRQGSFLSVAFTAGFPVPGIGRSY